MQTVALPRKDGLCLDLRREAIRKLLQEGLIGREEVEGYGELIDIRNRIVRLYVAITDEEIYEVLQDRLKDIMLLVKDLLGIEVKNPI